MTDIEGGWFVKQDYFKKYGVKVTKFTQKKGDIVVIAAGTLHWVRAEGQCMNSAWNTFHDEASNIQIAFQRQNHNKMVKFPASNVIPFKSLCAKYVDKFKWRKNKFQTVKLMKGYIQGWIKEE